MLKKKIISKHTPYICLFTLLSLFSTESLMAQDTLDLRKKVTDYFQSQTVYPQEKLYLHLDKPYYAAGEEIYWKAYLVNAISLMADTKSHFVYVELIDRSDKVVSKYKARKENGSFHGSITLPPDIAAGQYYLRAYTRWMLNGGEEYFYYRSLRIGNALDRTIQSSIRYEEVSEKGVCSVTICFTDETNKPLPDIRVKSKLVVDGEDEQNYSRRTNALGEINFNIPLAEKRKGERSIELIFDDPAYIYDKTFHLPLFGDRKNEFALSFFPEGGDLLDGCHQNVAFKAQQIDGGSCAMQGFLLGEAGDTLASFRTVHDGMGAFVFTPSFGKKYRVMASGDNVSYREFPLPEVKATGRQLSVTHRKGIVRYNVLKASQTQWIDTDTLYLVGHTRGNLTLFLPIAANNPAAFFRGSELPEGITELLLADRSGTVLSRRLVFIRPLELANLDMSPFPQFPERRKLVEIPLRITDAAGVPVQGSFSAGLTDGNLVVSDSLSGNIRSGLLLTSDLKGYIENPGYYFLNKDSRTEYNTDLLMLTHGWTRFRHDNIAEKATICNDHFMEGGQTIGGKAVNRLGVKAKNSLITLTAPSREIVSATHTDENGNFLFEGIEFQDTVMFVLQGKRKDGESPAFLRVDSIPYLPPHDPFPVWVEEDKNYREYDNTVRNAYLSEGGMQEVRLKDVTVTGRRSNKDSYSGRYGGINSYHMAGDLLERRGGSDGYDFVLRRVPGIEGTHNSVSLSGNRDAATFYIDGMPYKTGEGMFALRALKASDIASVEVVKGSMAKFLGLDGGNGGFIFVTLKEGAYIKKGKGAPGLTVFTMQGYSQSVEFYHPVYETPEQIGNDQSDIRTTVYWNPTLQTDADGKAVIRFYTPDNLIKPHLIIEGVASGGHLMRFER